MYLTDVIASLRRRWTWLIVAVLVTVVVTGYVATKIPTHYKLEASVVLVPPAATDDPKSNRYLSLGSLSQAASVLVRSLNSDQTHEAAKVTEPRGKFEVAADPTTSAPVIVITVDSTSRPVASRLLDAVLAQVPSNLSRLQTRIGTPETSRIVSVPVTHDDRATSVVKKKVRGSVATGLGLLVALLVGIAALDGLLRRKSEVDTDGSDDRSQRIQDRKAARSSRGRGAAARTGRRSPHLVAADRKSGRSGQSSAGSGRG